MQEQSDFKERSIGILRDGSSLPNDLVDFASAWQFKTGEEEIQEEVPKVVLEAKCENGTACAIKETASHMRKLIDNGLCMHLKNISLNVTQVYRDSLVHKQKFGLSAPCINDSDYLPLVDESLRRIGEYCRDNKKELLAMKLASALNKQSMINLKCEAAMSDVRVRCFLVVGGRARCG